MRQRIPRVSLRPGDSLTDCLSGTDSTKFVRIRGEERRKVNVRGGG